MKIEIDADFLFSGCDQHDLAFKSMNFISNSRQVYKQIDKEFFIFYWDGKWMGASGPEDKVWPLGQRPWEYNTNFDGKALFYL